jgi:pSer/pThr/pTyr-binding forkhead associated (FHA) protein
VDRAKATLRDLGSRNGTYIGDRRVTEDSMLRDGDQIVIGEEVIVFCGSKMPTTTRSGGMPFRR